MQMFGSDGKLQYWKELDPQLHVSGPCLSKVSRANPNPDPDPNLTAKPNPNPNPNPNPDPNPNPNPNPNPRTTLSKATYTAVSLDEAVSRHVTIRGSRTDDIVQSS